MRCAIVLGATSMLGLEVVRQLSDLGTQVIKAGRGPGNDIVVDLGRGVPPIFHGSRNADILFHCASAFGGDSAEGRAENLRVNISGCADVLQIADQTGVRGIYYAGSAFSYHESNADPMGGYGFSKAEAERILDWGISAVGGRFCSIRYGQLWDTEGLCCRHQPWFGRIVAYASRGLTLKMPASDGPRNFTHVSDAARLLIGAARQEIHGTYAASHPTDIDMRALARAAYRIFDCGGEVVIDPSKKPFRLVDFPKNSTLFELLNDHPRIALPDALTLISEAGTADRFGPIDVQ